MKSYINKLLAGVAVLSLAGFATSCVNDLDQLPKDPSVLTPANFAEDPQGYLAGVMAKCYSCIAVSGQGGPNGASDISGIDGGTAQFTRGTFMMNEFPTDEVMWIYQDAGVPEMVQGTWDATNTVVYGIYSRYYVTIAIANDFLRLTSNLDQYGITPDADLQANIDQWRLEARAIRAYAYYHVIDIFGNGVDAWDDMAYGETPPQTTRAELYNKVVADLEDVNANFPTTTPVYGRIGKDAVEGLLSRFYLNAGVYTGTPQWAKCMEVCNNIIRRHTGKGFRGTGLANDYLALFCGTNDMFMPGGSLPDQNEILWGVPYKVSDTEPWGGTTFLVMGGIKGAVTNTLEEGYCNLNFYGSGDGWGCMHTRQQFAEKFVWDNEGYSEDARTYMWLTQNAGYTITNDKYDDFASGYLALKFTNLKCEADGTLPRWRDPETGLPRAGVRNADGQVDVDNSGHVDTDQPLIRLSEIYLNYAEAALRANSNTADGLKYVNYVRQRAGVADWTVNDYTLQNVLDERARELYYECVRRTDLVRYGQFTGSDYLWNYKGNAPGGTALPEYRNIYPIPTNVLSIYGSSMQQNPGY